MQIQGGWEWPVERGPLFLMSRKVIQIELESPSCYIFLFWLMLIKLLDKSEVFLYAVCTYVCIFFVSLERMLKCYI